MLWMARRTHRRKGKYKGSFGRTRNKPTRTLTMGEFMALQGLNEETVTSMITLLNHDFEVSLSKVSEVLAEGRTQVGPTVDDLMDWLTTGGPMVRGEPGDLDKLKAFYEKLVNERYRKSGRPK
jgi:hypothetical protein